MAKAPSKEYARFDGMIDHLLTVPKKVLDRRVKDHKARAAKNPSKPGPKPKHRES